MQVEQKQPYMSYFDEQKAINLAALGLKKLRKDARQNHPGVRKARMLFDPSSGTTGYGAYRIPRRYRRGGVGARRSFGQSRRRLRGRGGFFGDLWSGVKKGAGWLGSQLWDRRSDIFDRVGALDPRLAAVRAGLKAAGVGAYDFHPMGGYGAYDGNGVLDQGVPDISNPGGSDGVVMINHKEYICDIVSNGGGFNLCCSFDINAGNPATFPWLSQIAQQFEQYHFEGLCFEFRSTSTEYASSTVLGEVILAPQYNMDAPKFQNIQQMMNQTMAQIVKPSKDAILGIETDPSKVVQRELLVRGDVVPAGKPKQFYDLATVYCATNGQASGAANLPLGQLWVTYQCALSKPQLASSGVNTGLTYSSWNSTNYNSAKPLLAQTLTFDNLGVTIDGVGGLVLTFPANAQGLFEVTFNWAATTPVTVAYPSATFSAGIANQSIYPTDGGSASFVVSPLTGATSATMNATYAIYIANTGAYSSIAQTITLGAAGTIPTAGGGAVATVQIKTLPVQLINEGVF